MAAQAEQRPAAASVTHTIAHYEIPAAAPEKLIAFYSGVFGWKFQGAPGMETYRIADTGREGPDVAIFPREGEGRPTNYVSVESAQEYVEKIKAHGGTVIHQFTVPGMGHGAIALDPEQNVIGIWQPDRSAQPA